MKAKNQRVKRFIAYVMVVIMTLTAIPLGGLSDVDLFGGLKAEASGIGHSTYWSMDAIEAEGFIGFLYDTSKVTSEMKDCGNLYNFLTGALQRGSQEEIEARFYFTQFAACAVNKHIDQNGTAIGASTEFLISYLESKAGGQVDDGLAKSTLNNVKKKYKKGINRDL